MDAFLPTYPHKKIHAECSREKKYPASTYPKKKNQCELRG